APLLEAFRRAFPKGVINTVYGKGSEVVPMLLESGKVNVLTLIGSSEVADIELAVKECLLGALSFNGQRCTALKMLIVHQSIVDPFIQRFTEELAKLK